MSRGRLPDDDQSIAFLVPLILERWAVGSLGLGSVPHAISSPAYPRQILSHLGMNLPNA
jgi:hypothetical protein